MIGLSKHIGRPGKRANLIIPTGSALYELTTIGDSIQSTAAGQLRELVGLEGFVGASFAILLHSMDDLHIAWTQQIAWSVNSGSFDWNVRSQIFNNDVTYFTADNFFVRGCDSGEGLSIARGGFFTHDNTSQALIRCRTNRENPTSFLSTTGNCGSTNFSRFILRMILADANIASINPNANVSVQKVEL